MNQQEIISLLDEAIQVLEKLQTNRRKVNTEEKRVFLILRLLCRSDVERRRLLGAYAEDFHGCVGVACAEIIDRDTVGIALRRVISRSRDTTLQWGLLWFLGKLRREISSHGLYSLDEMLLLVQACVQMASRPFSL